MLDKLFSPWYNVNSGSEIDSHTSEGNTMGAMKTLAKSEDGVFQLVSDGEYFFVTKKSKNGRINQLGANYISRHGAESYFKKVQEVKK
jgi:hypothetical protein